MTFVGIVCAQEKCRTAKNKTKRFHLSFIQEFPFQVSAICYTKCKRKTKLVFAVETFSRMNYQRVMNILSYFELLWLSYEQRIKGRKSKHMRNKF